MSIDDAGFMSAEAARAVVRRMKLRRALCDAHASIAASLDRLDQQFEPNRRPASTISDRSIDLLPRDVECRIGSEPVDSIEGQDMGEQELLQGMDLVLQFLEALLDGLGHGRFSNNFNNPNANPAEPGASKSK